MFIAINKATVDQLRAVTPKQVKAAAARNTTARELRADVIAELKYDRVVGIEIKRGRKPELVKLPTLGASLADAFGGSVKRRPAKFNGPQSSTDVKLAVAPLSLRDTKAGIKMAMKRAGFKSQGRGLFPAKDHGATPVFYVERRISAHDSIMLAITLDGSSKRPQLVIEG
jgi:hypothetical protein